MPSSYVSGRVMSDRTEHSRAIIAGYVPSGHYFWSLFPLEAQLCRLSSRLEESWACGAPKVMKNAFGQQPLSMNRYPFLVIPTEAKRSGGTCGSADPSWKCFSTERSAVERSAVSLYF
jgi:hypothetical protein